jgi:membrane protein YqaA with SNARE-associated domain
LKRRLEQAPGAAAAVIFTSAVSGLPPFYLVSVAAGALRVSLARFLILGASGRFLRFASVVALPRLIGAAS